MLMTTTGIGIGIGFPARFAAQPPAEPGENLTFDTEVVTFDGEDVTFSGD